MKYERLNNELINLLGGSDNIRSVAHCVTRLRLNLVDTSKAETTSIERLAGVVGVVVTESSYQIVIGSHVVDVYHELMALLAHDDVAQQVVEVKKHSLRTIIQCLFTFVSDTMTSLVEVLLAAGMLAGLLTIVTLLGFWSEESPTYVVFASLHKAVFHFLPVFIAFSAAKQLKINPYIAAILALAVLSSAIDGASGLSLFGYPIPMTTYANTFIPLLLGVGFLAQVMRVLDKVVPKALQYFFVPMLALVLSLPVVLIVFGPLGTWLSDLLGLFVASLSDIGGNWLVVMLYAAFQPLLVVFGAHTFTYPLILNSLAQFGYDPLINHAATISDIAVAGAMLGYFLRARNTQEKQILASTSFSALLGITEPAIFGTFLKYRRPFLAVIIGGGIGGAIAGLAEVKTIGMVWGLAALPTYLAGGSANFMWMCISVIVSFCVATLVGFGLALRTPVSNGSEVEVEGGALRDFADDARAHVDE